MTADNHQGRRSSSIFQYPSIPRDRTRQGARAYILPRTAGSVASRFRRAHARTTAPLPLRRLRPHTRFRGSQNNVAKSGARSRTAEELSRSLSRSARDARTRERDGRLEGWIGEKPSRGTTENPSSTSAQRLAPDTSTLPTTPQPPPHARAGQTASGGEARGATERTERACETLATSGAGGRMCRSR